MNTKTAILIFARSAQADAGHKRLRNGVSVFEKLNLQIENTVKKTGLPYFIYTEDLQRGADFASRFTNALQDIYKLGFDNVISVGNDSPQLTKNHLLTAAEKLKTCPLVLGPSHDGGFYLMGLNKTHFDAQSFLNLPWQTASLTRSILRLVQAKKIHAELLPALRDLDTSADVTLLLSSTKKLSFQLRKLLAKSAVQNIHRFSFKSLNAWLFSHPVYFNKGSPLSIA
ncbi:TIGR04282 family arsenosugar biosynthesis glycosyltransferase [Leeuwenhoekiella sp. H156]|uniref:TIGR04282 family arsenosugar biosynthesis glycosyltransferase n=1 Tax=Leeuwenhoekiella sp. H156 TaxID=3450128 RepID=UPI003FA4D420